MKTIEVYQHFIKGKRFKQSTVDITKMVFDKFAEYSPDWPTSGAVINEFLNGLKVKDNTARLFYTRLNAAGEYMRIHYDLKNAVAIADKPEVKKQKMVSRKPDEIKRMLAACHITGSTELVMTFLDTGARGCELANLKGCDVHPDYEHGRGYIECEGKTGQATYGLDNRLCELLVKMAGSPEDYVFKIRKGNRIGQKTTAHYLSNQIRRITQRAGISGRYLGSHALRHSAGTLVARETHSLMAVQEVLQHSDPKSSKVYIDNEVGDEIKRTISPLAILGKTIWTGDKGVAEIQLELAEKADGKSESALVVVNQPEVIEGQLDYAEEMFPKIADYISIRPSLNTSDLNLIRKAFVNMARNEKYNHEMLKARELLKRMLRKAGRNGHRK